jgi:tetratricopeptide (TPR) repeat protein
LLSAKINTRLGIVYRWNGNHKAAKTALYKAIYLYSQVNKVTKETQELANILRLVPLPNAKMQLSDVIKCDVAYVLIQLGKLYSYSLSQYDKGLLNYNQALVSIKNIKSHESSVQIVQAFIYRSLAIFYYRIGKFQKADKLFEKSLNIMCNFLPNTHYLINSLRINFGANAYMLKDIKRAEVIMRKAVAYKYTLSAVHSQWLSKFYLGRIYESHGKYKQALNFFKDSNKLVENNYQKTLHNFTQFHITRAEFWPIIKKNSNVTYWQEALIFTSKLFGEKHYQTARNHFLLGQALANKGELGQAIKQCKLAMDILNVEKIKYPELIKFQQQNLQITKELLAKYKHYIKSGNYNSSKIKHKHAQASL